MVQTNGWLSDWWATVLVNIGDIDVRIMDEFGPRMRTWMRCDAQLIGLAVEGRISSSGVHLLESGRELQAIQQPDIIQRRFT